MDKKMMNMEKLFNPESVAVIGASDNPGKLGSHVMKSLAKGRYPGKIVPVNPGASEIMGIEASPSITDYEGRIDLREALRC